jgi:hypothetical protein
MNELRNVCWLVCASQAACTVPHGSCSDVDKGDRLEVEVLESWDEKSSFTFSPLYTDPYSHASCGDLTGIKVGDRFELLLGAYAQSRVDCSYPTCPADFPSASAESDGAPYPKRDFLCLRTDRKVTVGTNCELGRMVYLNRANDAVDVFSEPVAGRLPPVVLNVELSYSKSQDLTCTAPGDVFPDAAKSDAGFVCSDAWVVRIKKR